MADQRTICAVHRVQPAVYRCDGCQRALCEECVEHGHRLILCAHCGELAVPLATGRPVSTVEVRRERKMAAPYTLLDGLLYPFRGTGAWVFWTYVAVLVALQLFQLVPFVGLLVWIPGIIVALLVPRLLFNIVQTTADGEDELPEWPDFDFWARLGDAAAYVAILILSALPAVALVVLSGCSPASLVPGLAEAMGETAAGASCWPFLLLGALLGILLYIPAFGAPAVHQSFWLLPRVDLHARALLVAPAEALVFAVVLVLLTVVSWMLRFGLGLVPVLGMAGSIAVGVYATFTGAHLVGVFFRRHADALERLYLA